LRMMWACHPRAVSVLLLLPLLLLLLLAFSLTQARTLPHEHNKQHATTTPASTQPHPPSTSSPPLPLHPMESLEDVSPLSLADELFVEMMRGLTPTALPRALHRRLADPKLFRQPDQPTHGSSHITAALNCTVCNVI